MPHSFLTLKLDAGYRLTSRPGRFTPRKELRYALNNRLGGLQRRFGRFGGQQNLLPLPAFEPQTV
jgi:hypothetical protein